MSDALSDIARDERRGKILSKIEESEKKFLKKPTKKQANDLIKLYEDYKSVRGGYWGSSNERWANMKIGQLMEYLESGKICEILPNEDKRCLYRAIGGHNQWMGDTDEAFSDVVHVFTGQHDVVILEIDREKRELRMTAPTCATCPNIMGCYGYEKKHFYSPCSGWNEKEWKETKEKIKKYVEKGRSRK